MSAITAALIYDGEDNTGALVEWLASSSAVSEILLFNRAGEQSVNLEASVKAKARFIPSDLLGGEGINRLLEAATTEYLLLVRPGERINPGHRILNRLIQVAESTSAAIVYSDFKDELNNRPIDHPLIDYQRGSIRDSFDFGPVFLISNRAARSAITAQGGIDNGLRWGGLYDLRLKLSIQSSILRIPEPLYTRMPADLRATGEKQFDYVDPRQRDYQIEMETVATAHLKRIGAYLAPEFKTLPVASDLFPVRASIIIPVRNRERTISDAVRSALSQKASFKFNVIVVDNHSTDRTTEMLSDLARSDDRLVHHRPARTDLGIGGCWNEAIYSKHCGEVALQLDSDDLYADETTLERVVALFNDGPYAMVIGSYTIVNFDLQEIPPGLIDHREWTRENGRNNALRINGLGAPRAFYVPVLRKIGLPNVSYGEDYGVALAISRDYETGRIFDSIYFARRWEGNSDAQLPLETANRYDAYKDYLRTTEILARKRMNEGEMD